ncbi:hypothetical protein [Desulfosarcina cetonica]|uniref:hypothetical protein n=1 Tax=Desulfosarcina cetonica TaxID=90730 RepID=UPI00155DA54A|nr:hypothetical protein [Desulfosarcina cetonica]
MLYEDVVDGQIKPMPAGVTVQIWDDDTFNDDLIDTATTRASPIPRADRRRWSTIPSTPTKAASAIPISTSGY